MCLKKDFYFLIKNKNKKNLKFFIRDVLETELSAKKEIQIAEHKQKIILKKELSKQTKLSKATKPESEATTEISKHIDNNTRELIILLETELARLPREEDLKYLDPVSLYECKIQTILLLQKILSHNAATVGSKVNEKNQTNQNNTFLGIEIGLLIEILQER